MKLYWKSLNSKDFRYSSCIESVICVRILEDADVSYLRLKHWPYPLLRPSGSTPKLLVISTPQYKRNYGANSGCCQTDEVRNNKAQPNCQGSMTLGYE